MKKVETNKALKVQETKGIPADKAKLARSHRVIAKEGGVRRTVGEKK
jgi:hypothetical protein